MSAQPKGLLDAVLDQLFPRPPAIERPSESFLQKDIDRAVDYRKEYYKYVIGIATALLAFTLSFPPQLSRPPQAEWLVFVGWGGLGSAVLAGVRTHMLWAKFFISWRDYDNHGRADHGRRRRRYITRERRFMDVAQIVGLGAGVVGVVLFTAVNLHNIAPKAGAGEGGPPPPASQAPARRT